MNTVNLWLLTETVFQSKQTHLLIERLSSVFVLKLVNKVYYFTLSHKNTGSIQD